MEFYQKFPKCTVELTDLTAVKVLFWYYVIHIPQRSSAAEAALLAAAKLCC